jgi:hypothetical protein
MADMQPSEKASRPPKTDPARPARGIDAEKPNSGPAGPGPGGRLEDRPGSDPKNPGDFGHH